MNISFFVTGLDSGGLENYLLRFLQEKHGGFYNIYVHCKSGKGGQLENEYLKLKNVTIIKVNVGYFDRGYYNSLTSFFINEKVDAVCDFTGNFAGKILVSAKKAGIEKRIAFYRSSSDRFKKNLLKSLYNKWVKNLVYQYASNILSNSESAFNFFYPDSWKTDSRFLVIYNGINPKLFLEEENNLREDFSIPDDAFIIGHTGRFNEAKNHSTILAVAEALVNKYDDVYFILCGNGVKKNLKPQLVIKGLDDKILVFENRTDIPKFLNTMDCYFFPSTTEGQPNALIEAMVMGLPFIASNISPIRETVGNDYELYNPLDVRVLVEAVENKYLLKAQRDVKLKKEVIERFDCELRFNEFYFVLKN